MYYNYEYKLKYVKLYKEENYPEILNSISG